MSSVLEDFERAHACNWQTCERAATHAVRLYVPAMFRSKEPKNCANMYLGLECCLEHAQAFDALAFLQLNPGLKEMVRKLMKARRKVQPDFRRTFCEPVLLTDPGYLEFKLMNAER